MKFQPLTAFRSSRAARQRPRLLSSDRGSSSLPDADTTPHTTTSASGTVPRPTVSETSKVSSSYESPQDVVELHQDPDVKGQIIAEYLDRSKRVVIQVPSSEELAVERGIAQELQQQDLQHTKLNASAGTAGRGSKEEIDHGN